MLEALLLVAVALSAAYGVVAFFVGRWRAIQRSKLPPGRPR